MKILLSGGENKGSIAILIRFAGVTSKSKIKAIYAHYVDGMAKQHCCTCYHVDQSNLNKALKLIEDAAQDIDTYTALRYKPRDSR